MTQVVVTSLTKRFGSSEGDVNALGGVSFTIKPGEFYTLLGPSGCGKSTTLRCVAGLEAPSDGEIRIGSELVASATVNVPPHDRPIAMVFQSYAIWPHMSVFDNVAFPLKQRRSHVPRKDRSQRVMEALELVKMAPMANRPAPFLSGGQQQRVALARALVSRPQVLLLDEPLSNLDAKLREELRTEIKDLTKRLGITSIYVTHDQFEALSMSDRIAVMLNGEILQEGTPDDIYFRPANPFVAQFVGQINFIHGKVSQIDSPSSVVVDTMHGSFACSTTADLRAGQETVLAIRPESITAARQPKESQDIRGRVVSVIFSGDVLDVHVLVNSTPLRVRMVSGSATFAPGDEVFLHFHHKSCMALVAGADFVVPDYRGST